MFQWQHKTAQQGKRVIYQPALKCSAHPY